MNDPGMMGHNKDWQQLGKLSYTLLFYPDLEGPPAGWKMEFNLCVWDTLLKLPTGDPLGVRSSENWTNISQIDSSAEAPDKSK